MEKAWSLLTVKEINEEKREIAGIASTPTPDRQSDIVEPMGAKFKTPMPLLLYHDGSLPVGRVEFAKPNKDGIPFRASLPNVAEEGVVRDRVNEAWHSIKYQLLSAVSIGFRALEDGAELLKDGGIRWKNWEWLELSLVAIPAQPEALITSFKSMDAGEIHRALGTQPSNSDERKALIEKLSKASDQSALRAALGENAERKVVSLTSSPGASGQKAVSIKRKLQMKTYQDQIRDLEATRAAKAAELDGIQKKATDQGRTKDAAEKEQFDTLAEEIGSIDSELKDLGQLQKLNVAAAVAVSDGVTTTKAAAFSGARVSINAKMEPGVKFARMALAVARAKFLQKEGRFMSPEDIYRTDKRWMDSAPEVHLAMKAAVNSNDSTTAAAASEWAYAQNIASEFIEYLRPLTLLGRISGWRNVPFNVRVGGMDGGTTGYWVGQGLGINVSRPTSTSVSLGVTKVAGISIITKELAMLSTPSAELMVRNDLARAIQQKADTSLIDPNSGGVTNVTPISLTYGVSGRQASGTDFAAFKADWKSMTTNFYANNIPLAGAVVIMKEELAEALSLMVTSLGVKQFPEMTPSGGTLLGRPVFTTQVADTSGSPDYDNLLILLQPGEVFLADDGVATVEANDHVSIEMSDAPGNKSTATATGASLVSMFQTESIAIKGIRHVNWTKARSQACQYIRTAAYV